MKGFFQLIAGLVAIVAAVFGLAALLDSPIGLVHTIGVLLTLLVAGACILGLTGIVKFSKD